MTILVTGFWEILLDSYELKAGTTISWLDFLHTGTRQENSASLDIEDHTYQLDIFTIIGETSIEEYIVPIFSLTCVFDLKLSKPGIDPESLVSPESFVEVP
ncbi:10637_t:CDS:2 [Funneliformis mosseae]|uniref:10637_t:CDS:1 n=1 Tax=Funneliformis mosseae TaxID=27381 RepID=A0A9N9FMC6_FUNMO|nr:10637_t:CDS:2 [Funneliformis mosseae]